MRGKKPPSRRKSLSPSNSARLGETTVFPHGIHDLSGHTTTGIRWEVHRGDTSSTLRQMSAERFQCAVTSPPYFWQRDYKVDGQIGLEPKINEYVQKIILAMDEVKRVLKKDGVLFLNLGDTYYSGKGMPRGNDKKSKARRFGLRAVDASGLGVPRKTALGLPWRIALGMIEKGWVADTFSTAFIHTKTRSKWGWKTDYVERLNELI